MEPAFRKLMLTFFNEKKETIDKKMDFEQTQMNSILDNEHIIKKVEEIR